MVTIKIVDVVGSKNCIIQTYGLKLNKFISESIEQESPIKLSFEGVTSLTYAFLNASIGLLYKQYGQKVDDLIILENITYSDWVSMIEDCKKVALNPELEKQRNKFIEDLFNDEL